ncbi:MAG TPA: glycosyltransferase [Patescibacteria group bacterium]|jgi:mannosylfructose-phosphate synthase
MMLHPHGHVEYPPPLGKTDTGGQTIYVFQLAKALAKQGIKVDIFTRQLGDLPALEPIGKDVRIVRIEAHGTDFIPKEKIFETVPALVKGVRVWMKRKRIRYDVVHSHYWDGGYAGMLLSRSERIPHVHTPHSSGKVKNLEMRAEGTPPAELRSMYRFQVRNQIEQRILKQADATVVLSETNRIQLLQHYDVQFERLHVIYPGVDTAVFNPKPRAADKKLGLRPNAILTMSRMVPSKGLDRVVEALARLPKQLPFHLYMGGSIHDEFQSEEERLTEKQLGRLIKKHKLERRVTFLGNVAHGKELAALYRQAQLFILAGRYEPFGLTTIEAMACGTPPIVSDVAGSREIVVDELNGFIVDTGDRAALAETVKVLLRNKKKRSKVADNAAYTIRNHYPWEKISGQFKELYATLAAR